MRQFFSVQRLLAIALFVLFLQGCASLQTSSKKNIIETYIDLTSVENDQLTVTLDPGSFPKGEVTFYMPSVIPRNL
jgi:hypothetical protein